MSNSLSNGSLTWDEQKGYGFDSTPPMKYSGIGYFAKYQSLDSTAVGRMLTDARVSMVIEFYSGSDIVDIGIGGGLFCKEMGCQGYDVSAEAIDWLTDNGLYRDPYCNPAEALTFWDSLEHIPDPAEIVQKAKRWVFVSMPIYQDMADCLASKHYKPGEHLHYWTHDGLIDWFASQGFVCMGYNDNETQIGREGILSYAFKRV